MGDISHTFGQDLDLSAAGDFLYITGTALTKQRIIKRLMTVTGGYIWHLDYGAGIGQFVGLPANIKAITNAIRSQIFQEASVAQEPEPVVAITAQQNGTFICKITYTDAQTGQQQILTLPTGN